MGTATILGVEYQTVVMPDGKEWMAENLKYDGLGSWWGGGASDNGDGRYYQASVVGDISSMLADGWRIPLWQDWDNMFSAITLLEGGTHWESLVAASTRWMPRIPPSPEPNNKYGFNATPTGCYNNFYPAWRWYGLPLDASPVFYSFEEVKPDLGYSGYNTVAISQNNKGAFDGSAGTQYPTSAADMFPIRLVRDPITPTPIISTASGTYVDPLEVTITCETEDAVIHYTTDGSEPDEDSPVYTRPIDFRSLNGTGTVKAIAYSPSLPPSSVATANYTFKLKVFIQPESGGYSDYINCSIRTNHIVPETVVYYTTDGSTPTEASLVYSEPFTITPPYSGEFVVKAFAVNASFVTSDIETESYYYKAPSPIDKASLTLETGLEGFNPITGKFNRLGCSGAVLLGGNLAWELTDTEYELFAGWIAFCGGEEARLTIPMITGDVELPHVIQSLELLSVGRDTGVYSLSANAKIVTRPFPDGFSWQGWAGALYGPPATYPTELPSPQWGFSTAPQALFVATGGVSTAARLRQARGSVLKASWKLSGAQFDYWLAWFCWSLAFGRRKFVFDQAGVGPWRCQFIEDPKLNIDGVNFTVTATLFYVETGT